MTQIKTDEEIKIINARMPDEFTEKVNQLLKEGCWRIAETEMSVTDHHYWAFLIKSDKNPSPAVVDLYEVVKHAIALDYFAEGGSTLAWAKDAVEAYEKERAR